jgi:hypothetical protein
MNEIFFPRNAGFLYAEYELNRKDLGSGKNFDRWHVPAQGAYSFGEGDRNTVILRVPVAFICPWAGRS